MKPLVKYQIGLAVLGVFALVVTGLVVVQGGTVRQDARTQKLADKAATKLNNYTTKNDTVPDSLEQAGVSETSPNIRYTKKSSTSYEFCVTFKSASNNFSADGVASDILWGGSVRDTSGGDSYSDQYYLYIPADHKKGETCYKISLYGSGFNDPYYQGQGNGQDKGSASGPGANPDPVSAADKTRKADLDRIQAALEEYYANNSDSSYPTLAELNDAAWRKTNQVELPCDPAATSKTDCKLAENSSKGIYGYKPVDSYGVLCTKSGSCSVDYELTTTFDSGKVYKLTYSDYYSYPTGALQ